MFCLLNGQTPVSTVEVCLMISKIVATVLVCVLVQSNLLAETQPQAQTVTKMQQVLHKAQEKNKAVKVSLLKKKDGQHKFTGRVVTISDTDFAINDQKSGQTMSIRYEDVQQVSQSGMSTGTIVAIVAVVAGGIILGVIFHELGKD
jgi:Na+-transporting NADH:ubiquinone oxidoreductase subunit NqrC